MTRWQFLTTMIRWRFIAMIALLCCVGLTLSTTLTPQVWAQDQIEVGVEPPSFTIESLTTQKNAIADDGELTPEQKKTTSDFYDTAINAMRNAAQNMETAKRLDRELRESPQTIEQLRAEVDTARSAAEDSPNDEPVESEELLRLEQELIAQDSKLSGLRAEVQRYTAQLENLLQRPVAARDELADARVKLNQVETQIETINGGELNPVETARRASLRARRYFRLTQILALEQEAGSRPARQEITTLRRDLAQIKVEETAKRVAFLESVTGQSRLNEVSKMLKVNRNALTTFGGTHPLVTKIAEENVALAEQLREMAVESSLYPKKEAYIRGLLNVVNEDLIVAKQLIKLGDLNRDSSKTLRRLRDKVLSSKAIKSDRENTNNEILEATQDRLLAQENLRKIASERTDRQSLNEMWLAENPDNAPLTETNAAAYEFLRNAKRNLLSDLSKSATHQIAELIILEESQSNLLKLTNEMSEILDQNLLWLPSVQAIDFSWPGRVVRGIGVVFSLDHITKAATVPLQTAQDYWLLVFVFGIVIFAAFFVRSRLAADIHARAQEVGRVQKDSYWHTPTVILACVIMALPLPLTLLVVSQLFGLSESADPFIIGMRDAFLYLSIFTMFFLTWREWNRDKSLFDTHYKLPAAIRHSVYRQFKWFIPLSAISGALIVVTDTSPDPDVYEGVSVLAFMITALALSVFGFKILWARRNAIENFLSEDSAIWKYRKLITVFMVGLPVFAALLAAAGYYETASTLLGRLFVSSWLLIGTYVVYGLIGRTVIVAQRRLHLRQAIERRDNALKARAEKAAAEERGDVPPPPQVDYKEIDVESMSRQTAQLLYTIMAIGFAALMWTIWSDLLPALSFFDRVDLWPYETGDFDQDGNPIKINVTLWSLIQVGVIAFLTYVAAKNLPAFLELFVLKRAGLDAGARYAFVTILGYIIVAIGMLVVFDRLGLEWSKLQWLVAGLGVGIGFGLQEIIANFISGLIILFERPVRIGDYVTIGDQSGTVTRIQIRATTLGDLDNREILIPNKELITGRVTNWTLSNSTTRIKIPVGIAYGSDTDKAQEIMMNVLSNNPTILKTPAPQAFFLGFGDSSLDFELRIFLKSFEDRYPVSHAIHTEINRALEKAGITIPFPQRDLNIMTQAVPIAIKQPNVKKAETKKLSAPKSKPKPQSKPKPSSA